MHSIHYDPKAHLLRFEMVGLWKMDDVQRFAADLLKTVQAIPMDRRDFAVLSETTAFPVQTTEVSTALGHIMDVAQRMNTGRTAIIVGSMLNKLQAERYVGRPGTRVFLNAEQARAWLAEPEDENS